MFDSIVEKPKKRGLVTILLAASLGVHAVVLAVVLIVDQLRVNPVSEPSVTITFVDLVSAPPPPPPPPPPKKRAVKKVEVKEPPKIAKGELLAPTKIPDNKPAPADDKSSDDGVEGGVEGGVAGGVIGGVSAAAPAPPPPPPPPPAAPTFQEIEFVRKRRLVGAEPAYPPAALKNEEEGVLVVKLVVDPQGNVSEINFQQTHPAFEAAVRDALRGWKFAPHLVNGVPVSIYTIVKFTFKLQ